MTITALATALPIFVESTAGPTESPQFRAVGPSTAVYATRWVSMLSALAGFWCVVGVGTGASWDPLLTVMGAIVMAVLASIVGRQVQRRWHGRRERHPEAFVGVAITTQRVVCMSAAPNAAPVVTVNRPRGTLRGVSVGTAAPRWYLAPIEVVRFLFHDGTTLELLMSNLRTDGTESALRLSGIAVFDLAGAPRPRPDFGPTGFVPTPPRRLSTRAEARAKVLSCSLLMLVLGVSSFAGLYLGTALAATGDRGPADVLQQQCTSQVVRAVRAGDEVRSVRFESATEFGRGTLVVGAAQVEGVLGSRQVDFTCAHRDDEVQVQLAE